MKTLALERFNHSGQFPWLYRHFTFLPAKTVLLVYHLKPVKAWYTFDRYRHFSVF